MKSVGVVGLGYVGLPLAEAGLCVVGVEADHAKLSVLGSGESYEEDVPADGLSPLVDEGRLRFTNDYGALREVEASIICLPTPLDEHREPDLSAVVSGTREVARNLRPGALVVLESTTYPGTTREVVLPVLEQGGERRAADDPARNRRLGEDFYLAFSPEHIDPGNKRFTLKNTPKVVGA